MWVKIAGAAYDLPDDIRQHGLNLAMFHVLRALWAHHDQVQGREAMRTVQGPALEVLSSPMYIIEGLGTEMMPDEFF